MGVPAFYRWLSEKYPKIIVDILEKRSIVIEGIEIPLNLTEENPNNMEYDNLYIDMNGLIHPCSHPEDREAPKTEEEMYINIMKYLDRLFAAIRPRRLLYLAIDGVAPRAKMNQQRSRRFRAAQDSLERQKMIEEVRQEMSDLGLSIPHKNDGPEWDSNVITPGTEFMNKLSTYIWFYVLNKMNSNPAWRNIKVVFSDASVPGEGEHKIMEFIRSERCQPGYDPNQRHVIHGLDADLIMLALATHEVHFTILREKVTFGKQRDKPQISQAQRLLNEKSNLAGASISTLYPEDEWVYSKPLQALHIHILRDYLYNEFRILQNIRFGFDFERIIDDFVFMCFFVGNDFLPHLPSLDIRDGALDFLLQCYKDMLESLGNYLTSPGGQVNLRQVDIVLSRVGEVEDEIFRRRKIAEDEENQRKEYYKNKNNQINNNESSVVMNHSKTIETIQPLGRDINSNSNNKDLINQSNKEVALKFKQSLLGKRSISQVDRSTEAICETVTSRNSTDNITVKAIDSTIDDELVDDTGDGDIGDVVQSTNSLEIVNKITTNEEIKEELKKRIKAREDSIIDKYKSTITDNIRLHESGWRQRYYDDKFKKEDIEQGGGLQRMCETYVQGLCWVLKYYYEGCPSWNWYYPFHYAPFASDLINIDKYIITFEKSKPFRPIEQLLAVLPSQSAHALPEECQWLMTEPRSPIFDLYVSDAPLDPNGKHLPWLWVLLLPFVDENRIMKAYDSCKSNMSIVSRRRNTFGHPLLFVFKDHKISNHFVNQMKYEIGNETDSEILSIATDSRQDSKIDDLILPSDKISFTCDLGDGICGYIAKPLPQHYAPLDRVISSPKEPAYALEDIKNNQIISLTFQLFDVSTIHKSSLLPGVIIPDSVLSDYDLAPRRPPRLGRGKFNMLDIMYLTESNQNNNNKQGNNSNLSFQGKMNQQYNIQPLYNQPPVIITKNNYNLQNSYSNQIDSITYQQQYNSYTQQHTFNNQIYQPPIHQPMPMFNLPQPQQLLTMDAMRSQLAQVLQGRPQPPQPPQLPVYTNPYQQHQQLPYYPNTYQHPPPHLQYNNSSNQYIRQQSTDSTRTQHSQSRYTDRNTSKQTKSFSHSAPMGFGQQPYDPRVKK